MFDTGVEQARAGPDGVWTVDARHRREPPLRRAARRQRAPLGSALARAAVPGAIRRRRRCTRTTTSRTPTSGTRTCSSSGSATARWTSRSSRASWRARRSCRARRGAYVVPKYLFGRPLDQIGVNPLTPLLPFGIRRASVRALYRIAVGRVEDYGLPAPDHRLLEAHPTVSADFLDRIAQGEVTWKPNVETLQGDRVRFADGTLEPVDVIVWCTGYKVTFPFFDEGFISAPRNELPLYRRVFKPGIDNLVFIALLQPLGATMPLAEAQGRWVAAYLRGEYRLPAVAEMEADIEREVSRMRRRYVASQRHTMQVDFDNYLFALPARVEGRDAAGARGGLPASGGGRGFLVRGGGSAGKRWRYSERVTVLVGMMIGLRLRCGARGGDPWPTVRSAA